MKSINVLSKALAPNNVVFATARNKHTATHLNTALGGIPYKNVHVLEADVSDPKTLQVSRNATKITVTLDPTTGSECSD